jgi:hypothetical protein
VALAAKYYVDRLDAATGRLEELSVGRRLDEELEALTEDIFRPDEGPWVSRNRVVPV